MVTSAKEWKGKIQTAGADLELPSGNVALVRQISPAAFLSSGFLPDPLTAIVRQSINTKQGLPPAQLKKMTEDPKQLGAAMETFDRVLTFVVLEPSIVMPPTCDVESGIMPNADDPGSPFSVCDKYINDDVHDNPTESGHHQFHEGPRDPETLYADEVSMDDKMFVFQWALGGTSDLIQFREEQRKSVASVSDGKKVRSASKRTSGDPRKQ